MSEKEIDYGNYQKGILSDLTHNASFLTIHLSQNFFELPHDTKIDEKIKQVCAGVHDLAWDIEKSHLTKDQEPDRDKAGLIAIIGFSTRLTKRWLSSPPKTLREYADLKGKQEYSHFPATGGDIFLHIKSNRRDLCFLLAKTFYDKLKGLKISDEAKLFDKVEEVDGFSYLVGENGLARDFTGFEDGTGNPKTKEKKLAAAIIPAKISQENAGGSFVITQRWVHDLDSFFGLAQKEQEEVIGRTQPESKKLKDKPETAHVSRVEVEGEDGKELKILRHSMTYGTVQEHGLNFIGYSSDPVKFDTMLHRMLDSSGMNPHLDMMKYIDCVSGQYFYIPSMNELKQLSTK